MIGETIAIIPPIEFDRIQYNIVAGIKTYSKKTLEYIKFKSSVSKRIHLLLLQIYRVLKM